jgi:hypothetical protein
MMMTIQRVVVVPKIRLVNSIVQPYGRVKFNITIQNAFVVGVQFEHTTENKFLFQILKVETGFIFDENKIVFKLIYDIINSEKTIINGK